MDRTHTHKFYWIQLLNFCKEGYQGLPTMYDYGDSQMDLWVGFIVHSKTVIPSRNQSRNLRINKVKITENRKCLSPPQLKLWSFC